MGLAAVPLDYLELYKRHAHADNASWLSRLLPAERVRLEEIAADWGVSVAGLMHWRMIADAQVGKEIEKAREKRRESAGGADRTQEARAGTCTRSAVTARWRRASRQ